MCQAKADQLQQTIGRAQRIADASGQTVWVVDDQGWFRMTTCRAWAQMHTVVDTRFPRCRNVSR